ncbi:hypothetical protein ABPG75_012417 [Micractinium tetrahymenae]
MPQLHGATLLPGCPINPASDRYLQQEAAKEALSQGRWRCRRCGKRFLGERYLDAHLAARHPYLEAQQGNASCLADWHATLHTRQLSAYLAGDGGWAADPRPCLPTLSAAAREACLALMERCLQGSGAGPAHQRLHALLAGQLCQAHTCDKRRKRRHLQAAVKMHRRQPLTDAITAATAAVVLCTFWLVLALMHVEAAKAQRLGGAGSLGSSGGGGGGGTSLTMAAACFRATYTLDGHKKLAKNRRWLDGFVSQQGQEGRLYSESGALVATARLAGLALKEGAELNRGQFGQTIIVTVDVPCSPEEVHGPGSVAQVPEDAPQRQTFMPPTAANVPAARQPPPSYIQQQPPQQRPLQQQAQWPGQAKPGTAPTSIRSDDDILRLLMGQAAPPPAPPAAEEPRPAKRARLQPSSIGVPAQPETFAPPAPPVPAFPAPAAQAAVLPAHPASRPKWSSFLAEEDELQLGDEDEASPAAAVPGGCGGWGTAPAAAARPGAAQHLQQEQGRQPEQPGLQASPAGAGQGLLRPATAAWRSGQGEPAGFRPIVRPPQAAATSAAQPVHPPAQQPPPPPPPPPPPQQQQQRQAPWQAQQRPPLQPNWQPPAPQLAGRPAAACGGGNAGAWKPPAQLRPAPGGGAGPGRPVGAAAPAVMGAASATATGGWNRLVDGAVQLGWPTAEEAARPARRVAVPDSFASSQQYVQVWSNALLEELNLRIAEVAQPFHSAVARASQQQQQPPSGPGGRRTGGGGAGGRGGSRGGGSDSLEACLRQARVPYYGNCELFIWKNNFKGGGAAKHGKRSKRSQCEESDGGEEEAAAKPDSVYLILKSGRQKSAEYRKDDLWVLSSTPDFRSGFAAGQLGDRSHAPWLAVARSLWHGPNQDGKFEIEFLSARPPGLGRSQAVYAIKGPDASSELGMIELLRSGAPATMPLLTHLLRATPGSAAPGSAVAPSPPQQGATGSANQEQKGQPAEPDSPCYSCSDDEEAGVPPPGGGAADGLAESPLLVAERICQRFGLNQEQSEVLQYVASWCQPGGGGSGGSASKARGGGAAGQAPPPVCLVHGPFGSGKSTLLVALLHFLLDQRGRRQGSPLAGARVLVSAHTNVAVDRVLLGLLESGCTDFLRVGPLRRVSRRLLGQSLHASESRATATAAAELREMLKEAGSPEEKAVIQAELAAAERGADRQRKRLLKTVPVVGVTCCSSLLSALDGQQFDVVILDECSQMVEPLSAVPLLRARARYLIAAGDPLQLPPVVASPAQVSASPASRPHHQQQQQQQQQSAAQLHGLLRPLFVRLVALGLPPFLLRRQYRCHPDISAVPNSHFYGGRLVDGCSAEQRASLLPGLPSLAFLDVRGQEQYGAGRSASNQAEAEAVVAAVERLAAAGVALGQIGVICFFRAQVALVRSQLDRRLPQLQQAEQRRRPAAAAPAGDSSGCEPGAAAEEDDGVVDLLVGGGRSRRRGSTRRASEDANGDGDGGSQAAEDLVPQGIQVATVDSFQGAECDVIILTTAITRPGAFASDSCRLNVALTRAKRNLLIVGCAPALQQSAPAFAALLARCRNTPGAYFPGRLPPPALQRVSTGSAELEQGAGGAAEAPAAGSAGGQSTPAVAAAAASEEQPDSAPEFHVL